MAPRASAELGLPRLLAVLAYREEGMRSQHPHLQKGVDRLKWRGASCAGWKVKTAGRLPADVSAISAETACGGELAVCSPLPPTRLVLARKPVLSK